MFGAKIFCLEACYENYTLFVAKPRKKVIKSLYYIK